MIVTEQKPIDEILENLKNEKNIFLIGCGECSTTCKTGGEKEVIQMRERLICAGKNITGFIIPKAPCVGSQVIGGLAKYRTALESSDSILVLACGLGVQSVKENLRQKKEVHAGCNTLFMSVLDKTGNLLSERCSACSDCILDSTGGICPVTRCPKGLLNGPCGGMNKGKCEVDEDKDCAWVLIYHELEENDGISRAKKIHQAKDYSRILKPRTKTLINL